MKERVGDEKLIIISVTVRGRHTDTGPWLVPRMHNVAR